MDDDDKTIFETYRITDGRTLGELRFGDLPGLIERDLREAWLLQRIYESVQSPDDMLLFETNREKNAKRKSQKKTRKTPLKKRRTRTISD